MPADLTRALGDAVISTWSQLPTRVQQQVFEAAVRAGGNGTREELALFLHQKHPRTSDHHLPGGREVPEPDSLGG